MERTSTTAGSRSTIQWAAMLSGVVFLLVGVAGFIPGITTNYDRLGTFGGVGALLLGLFGINWLESVVHLLYGFAGLGAASSPRRARSYFLIGGAGYIVLWVYGLVIDLSTTANFIGINQTANWLHFALGVVMIGVGIVLGGSMARTTNDQSYQRT